ncbi:MAG: hypothetical protein HY698_21675 [Deltaproteobacteria bacterium]|nr:hypothetical protein [Deltaproteobacteria bacterium]
MRVPALGVTMLVIMSTLLASSSVYAQQAPLQACPMCPYVGPGGMSCPGMWGMYGPGAGAWMVMSALIFLAVTAALVALTVYLWRRSRVAH